VSITQPEATKGSAVTGFFAALLVTLDRADGGCPMVRALTDAARVRFCWCLAWLFPSSGWPRSCCLISARLAWMRA
jgi:hypothetical protein